MPQAFCYFAADDALHKEMMSRWLVAFCYTCKHRVREGEPLERELRGLLREDERQRLLASAHGPNYCLLV